MLSFLQQEERGRHFFPFICINDRINEHFLAIALFIGLVASNRLQALGVSLFIWAFFVLFYEFLTLALLSLVPKQFTILLFGLSVICNPVELMRVWTITAMKVALYLDRNYTNGQNGQKAQVDNCHLWRSHAYG